MLDERYFSCKTSKIVQQVRWHPASPTSMHLVVLTTEDTLRLYDIQSLNLITVWHPERAFLSSSMRESTYGHGIQTLASLGETAIDFDFTPPVLLGNARMNLNKCEVEWPMLILRGNGDIFMLTASMENKQKVKIDGPLPIYPPSDDTYSMEDASALIVLKSTPPIVSVATCNGKVYHALLLSFNENDDETSESVEVDTSGTNHSTSGLYIFECIELELGISLDDNAELYSSPITLYADPFVPSRYFCLHEAGLHAIILPIVLELDKFAKCSEEDAEKFLPSLRQSQSYIEYLLCTRISGDETSQLCSSPLIGFRVTELPCYMIGFSSAGELIIEPLTSTIVLAKASNLEESTVADDNDSQLRNQEFVNRVRTILKSESGSSRPMLKLDPNVSHASEAYAEILMQEIDDLRADYFGRYQTATKEIERRIKLLAIMKNKQNSEIDELEKRRDDIDAKGAKLMTLSHNIQTKQNNLKRRSLEVLEKLKRHQPKDTDARKRLTEKLRAYSSKVQTLSTRVEELNKKQEYQENKIKEDNSDLIRDSPFVSDEQQNVITNALQRMGEKIKDLKISHQSTHKSVDNMLEKKEIVGISSLSESVVSTASVMMTPMSNSSV
ncbi:hypothetical protein V9T40_006020 [Parthenolecanium corni]|uniref:Nuclear pore complex protein Nup88 n=1 Tax=Parthenolecanium corni TaxID=536013 RepID=A0AAN9YAZ9_9HEMI